jgi:predicted TPR repeat methyltransferase
MAQERGFYKDVFESFVTTTEEFPFGDRIGKYDVVVSSGVLLKGNMPPCIFEIKDKLTKVGGYIVFSVSKSHFEDFEFGDAVKKLVEEGKWEEVKREETLKY